jgi:hypothetical protein
MKSNQKLSILFWLFEAKATKDGKAPIYVRLPSSDSKMKLLWKNEASKRLVFQNQKSDCTRNGRQIN